MDTAHRFASAAAPIAIIVLLALARLVPHIPNFAPISAMALFGGVYLQKRWAFILPLAAMLLSDYLLLYVNPFSGHLFDFSKIYPPQALFHSALPAVYLSFLVSGAIGLWLREHKDPLNVVLASAFCSLQFFLVTNAAVWMGGMYDRSILGLFESYLAGLPFLSGTLFGDFFYTFTFFGVYELVMRSALRRSPSLAPEFVIQK